METSYKQTWQVLPVTPIAADGRLDPAAATYLLLSITRRCNMRCPKCFFAMQTPDFFQAHDLAVPDAAAIIAYYAGLGIRQIVPNAEGEALLHPGYQEIVANINARVRVRPWLVSNGIELGRHAGFVAQQLCEVVVSVDGPRAEAYQAYRGGPAALFQQVLANIRQLVDSRQGQQPTMAVIINCVVTADRCAEMPAMVELAEELGVDGIRFTNFHPTGGPSEARPLYADDCQVLAMLRGIMLRRDYQVDIFLPHLLGKARPPFHCRMLATIVIGANGDFAPCCRIAPVHQWGNFFRDAERHNHSALREFRQRFGQARTLAALPAICQTCGYLCQRRPIFSRQQRQWRDSTAF